MAKKLLLADDSITIQKVVELVLAEEGFEIKATANGEDALNQVASFRPDIVLADIEMPKMNGYQLCEKIKSNPSTAGVPVILLAGAFEPVDEDLARKVGADDVIVKPFESQDLLNKINAVMAGRGATVEAGAVPAAGEALAVAEEAALAEEDLWAMEGLAEQTEEAVQALEDEASAESVYSIPESTFAEESFALAEEAAEAAGEEPAVAYVAEEEEAASPVSAAPAVSAAEMTRAMQASVEKSVSDAIRGIDFRAAIVSALMPELRSVAEKIVRESAQQIIQSVVSSVSAEVAAGIKKDIEKVIWETVPDLAESAIRKEIEAIKSEL